METLIQVVAHIETFSLIERQRQFSSFIIHSSRSHHRPFPLPQDNHPGALNKGGPPSYDVGSVLHILLLPNKTKARKLAGYNSYG